MTLAPGTRLGPYEVVAPLGAGGMGEVYRAKDTRLGRDVAVKILPAVFASDPERLNRFEKEARSASSLNHPSIVTIHDIGREGSISYIAMERVDGDTLRDLLAGAPMAIRKILAIATPIAEGLAKAHEAGIVHRDLKPENVMVTRDGLVKILDFGLAKLSSKTSGEEEDSHLPTVTGTSPGMIVGTVGYMSPEQAAGQPVDFHSDQFAFGSILYEMATGARAFLRKTPVDTLSAILNDEPKPIAAINPQVPVPLRWIVERCLAKDSRQRYASTDDLARDLGTLRDRLSEATSGSVAAAAEASGSLVRRRRVRLAVAGIAAVALLAAGVLGNRLLASRAGRKTLPSFHRLTFRRGNVISARFAPDGRTVVYGAAWDGAPAEVYTVRTDSIESRPIGLARAVVLAVSSKGELAVLLKKGSLSWGGPGTLARIPIGGGTPRELLENVIEADWAPNGEDLAVLRFVAGGNHELQYPIGRVLSPGTTAMGAIRVSPNGDLVAFADGPPPGETGFVIATIDRKGARRVVSRGWLDINELCWSRRGEGLLVAGSRADNERAIYAVALSGSERVLVSNAMGMILYDETSDGRLLVEHTEGRVGIACLPQGEARERELGWLDASFVRGISPDGKLLLFTEMSDSEGIYLRRTDGSAAIRLGDGEPQALSSDGRFVLALRKKGTRRDMVMMPTGPGNARAIPVEGIEPVGAWFLPNGQGFAVAGNGKDGNLVLGVIGRDGGRPRMLPVEQMIEGVAVSSAGDRFLYRTRDGHVRIVPLAGGPGATVPGALLDDADRIARWSPDGGFLYVVKGGEIPARIDRLSVATGRREPWKQIVPADSTGVNSIFFVAVADDEKSYAYSYIRILASDLYVVDQIDW